MTRPVRPLRVASGDSMVPWVIVGVGAFFALTATCLWLGELVAAHLAGTPSTARWQLTSALLLVRDTTDYAPGLMPSTLTSTHD